MRRCLLLGLSITLSSCVPSFRPVDCTELCLKYDGSALTLEAVGPFVRASVGVRAESVTSSYCATPGCTPDAEGRVLLRLEGRGPLYPSSVLLGEVTGLKRALAVVVLPNSNEGVVATLEPSAAKPTQEGQHVR